ncbi:hypothetical protein DFH07DRAFT_773858 [Mycena maculata]|uniref:Uncharacterized protein n=1 Tax=Mycena maculata TaxID=230809 RepID=A0AAD7J0H3_9AGAR|nr:hypothetical protein DFH07DRAFT_773858 [Mycena maculata]
MKSIASRTSRAFHTTKTYNPDQSDLLPIPPRPPRAFRRTVGDKASAYTAIRAGKWGTARFGLPSWTDRYDAAIFGSTWMRLEWEWRIRGRVSVVEGQMEKCDRFFGLSWNYSKSHRPTRKTPNST